MGCSSAPVLVVNAEVDSMGGVVEGGVGITNKSSPQKAAIEKVEADLRQECGVRDERKRELEFLEKGGNPLDYKLESIASVSVQSTSITDQHHDQFVTSEAKGRLAFTASPHRDSVESSGRPGTTLLDSNSADNLLLFDAENELVEGGRSLLRRSSVLQSEQLFQMDGGCKTREHGESATFSLPRKAYKRRNRSRTNRDGARLSSTDVNPGQGFHGTSLPSRNGANDFGVVSSDADNQNIMSNLNSNRTSPSIDILPKSVEIHGHDIELDELKSSKSIKDQVQGIPVDTASDVIAPDTLTEEMTYVAIKCRPSATTTKVENQPGSCLMNGFDGKIGDDTMIDTLLNGASHGTKVLDSESSCTQTSLSNDENNDNELCTIVRNLEPNGNIEIQTLQDGTTVSASDKFAKEMRDTEGTNSSALVNKEHVSACHSELDKDSLFHPNKTFDQVESSLEEKMKDQGVSKGIEAHGTTPLESGAKPMVFLVDNPGQPKEISSDIIPQESSHVSKSDHPEVPFLNRAPTVSVEAQSSGPDAKLASIIDEDSILKEAQIIEAKRKRIAELSVVTSPADIYQKSHWDYVLEEIAWLANDFAQERIWKLAAASQISFRVAIASRLRKQESYSNLEAKRVAQSLAKAVIGFWQSIKLQVHETNKELEQHHGKNGALSVRAYAVRFLECDKPNVLPNQAEVPLTPDRISDFGILDLSWEDTLTEENLFYTVPPAAVETYRLAIESHLAEHERIGSSLQEEVETSACDAAADFESHDNVYDEDEGETDIYSTPMAFEGFKSSRYGQKKRKHMGQACSARPYGGGFDLLPMQSSENKLVTSQFAMLPKRPGSSINVSIPTKRMRTASRRVISPFGAVAPGIQVPVKTDASSCDTNSFQDDPSTLQGGSVIPNCVEAASAGEFEKQLPFDSAEVSTRPKKKKKKAKHLNSTYNQRWSIEPSFQNEQFQRDLYQKRTEIHPPEFNGNNGLPGQPITKKPKLIRQSQDKSCDIIPPNDLSIPSPVGSQSNMSNSNKFIKMLGGRDRGRKPKLLKMPSGQSGSGSPWSAFEDQALVVLAHDLGANWELVSDAFNSTLHFKYIFRKAKECKERHICLTDGDAADSADDSGSSKPYQSTLPGIPKGSARQLFQRFHGPEQEETLKSHFEKIILIGKNQHYRKNQIDDQDRKQFQRPHHSHAIALSQVCPNNPSGGPVLTPLDLCDVNFSSPDAVPLGYQGALTSGLAIPNQGAMAPTLPASGSVAASQGASNMMISNNFSSSPAPLNISDRSGSLPAGDHQRMHLYNQMITGRNLPQSSISAPGAVPGTDRGAHMLSSGNGMGTTSVANRNMPIARPGLQGIPSSPMVNSGSMVSPGVGAGQGSQMARPREALNMIRPGLNQDSPRQMMVSDLQTSGNSQGASHFGGTSPSFTNQMTSPPVSSYPLNHQPSHPISPQQPQALSPHQPQFQGQLNHAPNTQQQAYAYRLAKERQLQHRFLQQPQQQQQFSAPNSLMPHVQPQTQLPVSSSPMPNSPQVQLQTSSPLTSTPSMNAMPQQQQKHQLSIQGVARNAQSGGSKPRPRPQQQPSQANRQHPQQRQQSQAQQQSKVVKGVGRGNLMMHQNVSTDVIIPNGVSTNIVNQSLEKSEPVTNTMQSQGFYSGAVQNSGQSSRQYMASQSNQTLPQHKTYSGQISKLVKHPQLVPQSDNSSQSHVPSVTTPVSSVAQQSVAVAGPSNQASSHQKFGNQSQSALQRIGQPKKSLVSNSASNAIQVVSQPSAHKWHASEPQMEANALNPPNNLSSVVSKPADSSEPVTQAGQGIGQRPLTSLPLASHDTTAQSQQQQQQSQQPHSPVPQPAQHQQPLLPLHSQQQAQLLQAGSGSSYGRTSDTRLE